LNGFEDLFGRQCCRSKRLRTQRNLKELPSKIPGNELLYAQEGGLSVRKVKERGVGTDSLGQRKDRKVGDSAEVHIVRTNKKTAWKGPPIEKEGGKRKTHQLEHLKETLPRLEHFHYQCAPKGETRKASNRGPREASKKGINGKPPAIAFKDFCSN